MIIRSFDDDGGGFDPKNYTPFGSEIKGATLASNTYVTILNINGSGYLSKAVFRDCSQLSGVAVKIKITIDGVVVIDSTETYSAGVGFVLEDCVYPVVYGSSTRWLARIVGTTASDIHENAEVPTAATRNYPTTSTGLVILQQPIFFESSCKVEVNKTTASTPSYSIAGGLLT